MSNDKHRKQYYDAFCEINLYISMNSIQQMIFKAIKVVHVDDHTMITAGIGKLLRKLYPVCEYIPFADASVAFSYLKNAFLKNEKVDILITDFVHPGPNGYDLANLVRDWELNYGRQPVQILLLTMLSDKIAIIRSGLKKKIFNYYLPLTVSEPKLISVLSSIIYR